MLKSNYSIEKLKDTTITRKRRRRVGSLKKANQ